MISRLTAVLAGLLVCSTGFSQGLPPQWAGSFRMISGDTAWCHDFTVNAGALRRGRLAVGTKFEFFATEMRRSILSDIDPNCRFVEHTRREASADHGVELVRVNEEHCGDRLRSRVASTLSLGPASGEIRLRHELSSAQVLECAWKSFPR